MWDSQCFCRLVSCLVVIASIPNNLECNLVRLVELIVEGGSCSAYGDLPCLFVAQMIIQLGIECCLSGDFGEHLPEIIESAFSFDAFSGLAGEGLLFFLVHICLPLAIAGFYDRQLHSFIYSLCI